MRLFFIDFKSILHYTITVNYLKEVFMKRLKLKSVFTKYMITFMLLIVFIAIILGVMVTTIANNYTKEARQRELYDTNLLFKTSVLGMNGEYETLEEKLKANEAQIMENLNVALFATPDCGVIILDPTGKIAFFAYKDAQTSELVVKYGETANLESTIILKSQLSEAYMREIYEKRNHSTTSDLGDFFSKGVIFYATALSDLPKEDTESTDTNTEAKDDESTDTSIQEPTLGENEIGVILTFSGAQGQADIVQEMSRTIVMTVIWILVASLIAIYGVSYSVTKPLREISRAARDFSHGKYDTRVPVRGNDELAELAKSFNDLATVVQHREEMQNIFLSNASHDLRTPMTTIAGFIDGILDGAIPPDKQEYYLNIIKNEIKRLSRLVTSLLDVSRLQSGERKFEMKPFNICEVVSQTVISLESKIEEKHLDVDCEFEDFDMLVIGDKDAINQVVYNLCHNAIKFAKENGKYRITIKTEGDKVRVNVYNEGVGIPKEEIPFVFDRFFKGDKSRGLDKTGAGLGLFISKTIILAHGEDLSVESEYGKYCMFTFTLKKGKK